MHYSLTRRLIVAASLVLMLFLGMAGITLNALYEKRVIHHVETELLGHVYTLLSAADDDEYGNMKLPDLLSDPRFNQTDSGLYAVVNSEDKQFRWRSASLLGDSFDFDYFNLPGEISYRQQQGLMVISYGISWENLDGQAINYTVSVAREMQTVKKDQQDFSQGLLVWLGGSALVLLVLQLIILYWSLKPLKRASREINEIREGQRSHLSDCYPRELMPLAGNINSLIDHAEASQQRYRHSLGDLAHSLKTPLALLQSALDNDDPQTLREVFAEQVGRIDELISYQLQRAALMGTVGLAQAVDVKPVIEKLTRGLSKVYYDRQVSLQLHVSDNAVFHGDEGDLTELLGNLIDNAFKYCDHQVVISARMQASTLVIRLEDDGKGIAPEELQHLLKRGERADEKMPGQGIGLSIVADIIALYHARLDVCTTELGGACLLLTFSTDF